jgi:predicted nucleotidyltransferase
LKNTILKNIERAYLKINTFENYSDDTEQFLKNQEHINNIMEEKYKDKFLVKIIQLINI